MYTLLTRKKVMTQMFLKDWKQIPVTLLDAGPVVLAKKSGDKGWIGYGRRKKGRASDAGIFKELGYVPERVINVDLDGYQGVKIGETLSLKKLEGAKVYVRGVSKGKGFAGVHKRFDVKGGPETHGTKDKHRHIGSIGAQTPGKVWKGQKMPGRHGQDMTTVKNLEIVYVDKKNRIIGIRGAVPGSVGSLIAVKVKEFGTKKKNKDE